MVAHEVDDVYENQRFFGPVGWKPPLSVLDAPEWSDAQGNPVALARKPSEDAAGWEVAVSPATDAQGWQHATVFKHLEYKRPGGRAVRRFNDTVRRRLWRRRAGSAAADAPAVAVPGDAAGAPAAAAAATAAVQAGSSSSAAAGAAAAAMAAAEASREAREAEAKRQAIKGFVSLVLDLLSRRQVWTIVPWDPAAIFLLYQKHQKVYEELQAQAIERRLFTADQPAPPSQLREGRTLLQDLLCAAMHSRAAYGFPAAAGMMSTVADYIKLQTIQPLTFDAVGGVSVESNNESVAALAGIAVEDILLAEWRNSPYRPCHYVAIDQANQCIVVSIRGSLQLGDLLSDLHAAPMEIDIAGSDGWVHQGIFSAATYVQCSTQAALQEAARRCPGWPVLLTGHSLGGGVAALLTLLLQEAGLPEGLGPVRCITMGTAAVMSRPLAEACNELVTSCILGSDVVPHLSVASVEALLLEASEASPVRRTVQDWSNKLAEALSTNATKRQQEITAVLNSSKIAGSWRAVKEASQRLSKSTSGAGLTRIASLVAPPLANAGQAQQQQQQAMQIPVIEQRQPAQPQRRGAAQQAGQAPRQIPVLDLSRPGQAQQAQQAAATAAALSAAATAAAEQQREQGHSQEALEKEQQQQQQQQQVEQQGSDDIAMPLAATDGAAVESAIAQEAAAAGWPVAGGASGGSSGAQGPGNPELLYPPGRIIWIFPADERMIDSSEAEEQLQAMDTAWQGAAGEEEEEEEGMVERQQHAAPGAAAQQQQQAAQAAAADAAAGSGSGSSRGRFELTNEDAEVQGRGAVNIGEAMEAVETGHTSAGVGRSGGGGGGDRRRRQPTVVDAERTSFERLLLMPDMLDDHLPDRIVAALQQL
ncbi:hypothetical protein ABPG75_009900 [Micractinium tetrahymenae]